MLKSAFLQSTTITKQFLKNYTNMFTGKSLEFVVQELEKFSPTSLAEKWDNVGLLIEPFKKRTIKTILVTNDLTEFVMEEAIAKKTDLIISYHPPIFLPLNRITQNHWKQRIVSMCLSESIAVYSPHTSWDIMSGGVNDWLASALPCSNVEPVKPSAVQPELGIGRIFDTNITLKEAISSVKSHIGTDVHLSIGVKQNYDTPIKRVAVCAGSGSSTLRDVKADLFITGEMSHHEVLDAVHNNTSVILCNHSNSERGFLQMFKTTFSATLNNECEIIISVEDRDPLVTIATDL